MEPDQLNLLDGNIGYGVRESDLELGPIGLPPLTILVTKTPRRNRPVIRRTSTDPRGARGFSSYDDASMVGSG